MSEDEFSTKLDEFVKKHQHGSNETHLKECLRTEWKEGRDKEDHELAKVDAWIEKVAADKCKHDDASKVDSTSEKKPTEAPTEKIETSTHAHNHNDHRQDANKKTANHQPQKSDKSAGDKLRFNGKAKIAKLTKGFTF